jgi:hypothetical protein
MHGFCPYQDEKKEPSLFIALQALITEQQLLFVCNPTLRILHVCSQSLQKYQQINCL